MIKHLLSIFTCAIVTVGTGYAQERTAGGPLDTQMTWATLSQMAKTANDKAVAVNSRVDQIVVCARKGMLYAPEQAGADSQGCYESRTISGVPMTTINNNLSAMSTIVAGNTANIQAIIDCNKSGLTFNGISCVAPTSSKTTVNMNACIEYKWKGLYGLCPANHVLAGAKTRNSDTGEWDSVYCCPLQ